MSKNKSEIVTMTISITWLIYNEISIFRNWRNYLECKTNSFKIEMRRLLKQYKYKYAMGKSARNSQTQNANKTESCPLPLQNDLFNNPMVENARKSMSPEQLQHYKEIGEQMHNSIDFNTNQVLNQEEHLIESVAYVMEGLKSGLHFSYLSKDEEQLLENHYGKDWKSIVSTQLELQY